MKILRSPYALILTAVLIVQGAFFYLVAQREEQIPVMAPLSEMPETLPGFYMSKVYDVDQDTRDLLRADDLLSREYISSGRQASVGLFIAYFKTQRYGQSPHSPKNCLPGSGWEPVSAPDRPKIQLTDGSSIQVNRYIVQKGDNRSITLYWYQTHSRVIASEYSAKFWLVADALRYHRSDTSLVRVVVPVGDSLDDASQIAIQFVRALFPALKQQLPI